MFYGSQESCNNRTFTKSFPCGLWLQTREESLGGGRGCGTWDSSQSLGLGVLYAGAAGCRVWWGAGVLSPGSRLWEAEPGRRERKRKTEAPQLALIELPGQLVLSSLSRFISSPLGTGQSQRGRGRAGESTGSSAGTAAWRGRPSGEEKGAGPPAPPAAGSLGLPQLEAGLQCRPGQR